MTSKENNFINAIMKVIEKKANIKKSIICTVITPPPNITLKYENITIPTEQIYVANYLLQNYHRQYKIDGIIDNVKIDVSKYDFDNITNSESVGDHPAHPIPKLSGSGTYKGSGIYQSHKDIWFEDTLKAGDEVLVNLVGVYWVVVSKVTKMPSQAIEGV